ncbi:MAG TPA: methionyl-tRNA formyltransferase [Phycisphaerae bacterium]|nr:methionyl-tRNA formyltransferase [Phycisphaerae bacterium]
MRIVFAASGSFGLPALGALVEGGQEIALIVTQPDRPSGRGRQVRLGQMKWFARERDIPIIQPENINAPSVVERIRQAAPELLLVIAFGQKIGPKLLDMPKYGAINLHGSLLPKYRGAAPINWAVIEGETETGLTVIAMTEQMDAGDILGQRATPVEPNETAGEVFDRLSGLGARVVTEVVREIPLGEVERRRQNENQVTLAPRLKKADGLVHWDQPALQVHNRIRGVTPWPGAFGSLSAAGARKALRLVIDKAVVSPVSPVSAVKEPAGTVVAAGPEGIDVAAARGAVRLLEVTPEGKRAMSAADFLNGHPVKPGARFRAP